MKNTYLRYVSGGDHAVVHRKGIFAFAEAEKEPVRVLCGFTGINSELARRIWQRYRNIGDALETVRHECHHLDVKGIGEVREGAIRNTLNLPWEASNGK